MTAVSCSVNLGVTTWLSLSGSNSLDGLVINIGEVDSAVASSPELDSGIKAGECGRNDGSRAGVAHWVTDPHSCFQDRDQELAPLEMLLDGAGLERGGGVNQPRDHEGPLVQLLRVWQCLRGFA